MCCVIFFFSSRRRHTRYWRTGVQTCALPIYVCSTTPAKIFGLYPKKGAIQVGSDADIVIIDPNKEVTLTKDILHENVDYTAYEGFKLKGYPVLTMKIGRASCRERV